MRSISIFFFAVLSSVACTRFPDLNYATAPVSMPQPLRKFPLTDQSFHDCRFVMFKDGTPGQRAEWMQSLISNSLRIYHTELTGIERARTQGELKKKSLIALSASSLSDDVKASIAQLFSHQEVEISSLSVYLPADEPTEAPTSTDLWGFIRQHYAAKSDGNEAELLRFDRVFHDRAVIESLGPEESASSANSLFLAMADIGILPNWIEWSELRFKNGEIDTDPLAAIDSSTFLYNYQRTDIQISLGKDPEGKPWLTIDDWMLNAIPDPTLRDDPAEDAAEQSYRFASANAPDLTDRLPNISNLVYAEEGGVVSFVVKTPGKAQFSMRLWRSKYDAPDSRIYYMGEIERKSPSGAIRRGTSRWIDKLLSEVFAEEDESAVN